MGYKAVFKRYEIKYMVTAEQKARILKDMEPYMEMDKFGRSTVRNIYFDTDDFVLARHSIAKPDFKEKLRVRCYAEAEADSTVFVELKRKFDGVVYKRRVGLREADAMKWMAGSKALAAGIRKPDPSNSNTDGSEDVSPQVMSEIEYFRGLYSGLKPVLYLSYDREAYRMKSGADAADGGTEFRVTFDCNIRCRETGLTLRSEAYGTEMLEEGMFLMELKCPGAIPLWMTEVLSRERLYKTSFSKYGTAYCRFMKETPGERAHMIAAAGYENYAAARAAAQQGQREQLGQGSRSGQHSRHRKKKAAAFGRVSA